MAIVIRNPFIILFLFIIFRSESQTDYIEIDPITENTFKRYMLHRHGGEDGVDLFKLENPEKYQKELWYYSASFYVKREHFLEGTTLDISIIDISRFESQRKENELSIVELGGYKDVLILIPLNQLIYRPE